MIDFEREASQFLKKISEATVFPPCCSSRIRAYDFQRVIRPSLALLRCPVVGPVTLFHAGWVGWSGKNSALNSLIFSRTVAGFALAI